MGNKASKSFPVKARSSIEPGAGHEIPGPLAVLLVPVMARCTCVRSVCYPCQFAVFRLGNSKDVAV